jgi:hypothetical protein
LDSVDIQTCWVERQAVRGKGRHGAVQAMTTLEQQLPFPLRGIDSDNVLHLEVKRAEQAHLSCAAVAAAK